jgi:hypothetical protein
MAPAFERLQEVVIEVTYWGHGFPAWWYRKEIQCFSHLIHHNTP